jgi:hypothetical protein
MSYAELVAEATARPNGPSEKQINFVLKLAGERRDDAIGSDGEERIENVAARIENGATRQQVSTWISHLLRMPVDTREVETPVTSQQPKEVDPALTPGVYDVSGQVFVVKPNQRKTGLYAKRLVEIAGERLNEENTLVNIEFVYAPGAIFDIKPEQKMSLEDAKWLTIRYGRCIVCGRRLKAGKSVEQGIGPVCIKSFA